MENIFKRLEFVIQKSDEITKHFDKREREEVTLFSLCMLDRLNFSSESLMILMNQFNSNTKVEYSCGIIIRSVLLDYLIVLNAHEIYDRHLNDVEKLYEELKGFAIMMLCDTVRNTLEHLESLESQFTQGDMQKMYTNIVDMNPECFEAYKKDGSKPKIKSKDKRSPKQLFNVLMKSKSLKNYRGIYEIYLFYSKYDHFGQMFYQLSRKIPIGKLENIDRAIKEFPRVLLFTVIILETLYGSDNFLKIKRQEIVSFMDEID
jgi:hypothetical protein